MSCVHLTSGLNAHTRAQQLDALRATVSDCDTALICGDFNACRPADDASAERGGFTDLWPAVHGVRGGATMRGFRLDRICLRSRTFRPAAVRVVGAEALPVPGGGGRPITISDHAGLVASIALVAAPHPSAPAAARRVAEPAADLSPGRQRAARGELRTAAPAEPRATAAAAAAAASAAGADSPVALGGDTNPFTAASRGANPFMAASQGTNPFMAVSQGAKNPFEQPALRTVPTQGRGLEPAPEGWLSAAFVAAVNMATFRRAVGLGGGSALRSQTSPVGESLPAAAAADCNPFAPSTGAEVDVDAAPSASDDATATNPFASR